MPSRPSKDRGSSEKRELDLAQPWEVIAPPPLTGPPRETLNQTPEVIYLPFFVPRRRLVSDPRLPPQPPEWDPWLATAKVEGTRSRGWGATWWNLRHGSLLSRREKVRRKMSSSPPPAPSNGLIRGREVCINKTPLYCSIKTLYMICALCLSALSVPFPRPQGQSRTTF
jgi:hypothetical protein